MKKKRIIIISIISVLLISLILVGVYFVFFSEGAILKLNKPDSKVPEKQLKIMDVNSKTRPYAIMINNLTLARPYQTGLNDAYIVYEMVVEGGITRMMALFKDQSTAKVGTVRSARHYYLDYAMENDAIYVHWGWSPQAQSDISKYSIDTISTNNSLSAFYRDDTLPVSSEHRGYTDIPKLNEALAASTKRKETNKEVLLNYSIDPINLNEMEAAIVANSVVVPYSAYYIPSFTYNAETKLYQRVYNNEPHIDHVTKEQFTTKNIITYQVQNVPLDNYGRQDLRNVGIGEGYYITNGYAVPITWEKTSRDAQTIYKYKTGEEIDVNDGNTYIQIQPVTQTLTIQ